MNTKANPYDNRTQVGEPGRVRLTLETDCIQGVTHAELAQLFTQLLRGHGYTFDGEFAQVTEEDYCERS